jgi:outer membrane biosynthesis protein TonB
MPPKRKVIEDESSVDGSSGLSSPLSQGDLELEAKEQKPTAAKKRKIGNARTSEGNTVKKEVKEEDDNEEAKLAPKRQPRKKVVVKEEDEDGEAEVKEDLKPAPKKQPRKKKVAVKEETTEADGDEPAAVANPAAKKRKTKEEKEAEAMPLTARTIGHKLFIGAHVSSAGGQYFFRIQLYSIDSMQISPASRISSFRPIALPRLTLPHQASKTHQAMLYI